MNTRQLDKVLDYLFSIPPSFFIDALALIVTIMGLGLACLVIWRRH